MDNSKKRTGSNSSIWFLLLLTLVVGISYGIGITGLSFYGDDWIYVYNYHIAGANSFSLFTQWDRPFSAWIYILTSVVFGESAPAYHFFVLFLRWLSAWLFYRILKSAFGKCRIVFAAALLFAVYPGFQQQPIAVEFVMHFTSLVLVLLSIRLMQTAFYRSGGVKRILLMFVSLLSGGLAIFTCEYFVGLELSRPFFLFFTNECGSREDDERLTCKKKLLFLIPYLCVAVFFFIWRIFIFSFKTYGPKLLTALAENPVNGIRLLAEKVLGDLITIFISAYRMIFSRPANLSAPLAAAILLLTGAAVFVFFYRVFRSSAPDSDKGRNRQILVTGCALIIFSGIPYWGTFLDVSIDFPWDRSTLSFSPGTAVLIALLLDTAFKPVFFMIAAAVLTALSSLFQVQNTQEYIYEASKMNDYFWQLAWRVPGLEDGTIIASDEIPLDRTSDNDLSPVVNWQYAPENKGLQYRYKYFDLDLREWIYYTAPLTVTPVDHTYRSHMFTSSTAKTLGIFYKKNGCLQIIDRTNSAYPDLPESLIRISPLSDPGLILTGAEIPAEPPVPIGKEPDHGYCYYFQKTSLALQADDLATAHSYALKAFQSDLHPVYAPDLAPVILALLKTGDISTADSMMAGSTIGSKDLDYLCTYWLWGASDRSADPELTAFFRDHGCL